MPVTLVIGKESSDGLESDTAGEVYSTAPASGGISKVSPKPHFANGVEVTTFVQDIDRLAQAAVDRFGGFDTWINNAGQGLWGRLEDVSDADHRQLFDINFWSVVYGSTTALRHLKGKGGALLNLGSVASDFAFPIQGMYSTTKHAIKGFTDALRRELKDEGVPVSITLISLRPSPHPSHCTRRITPGRKQNFRRRSMHVKT